MARAAAGLLKTWGVDFGILGADEHCDGSEVRDLGEKGLFENLVERNLQQLQDLKVRRIITLSPHAFNAFKEDYPPSREPLKSITTARYWPNWPAKPPLNP